MQVLKKNMEPEKNKKRKHKDKEDKEEEENEKDDSEKRKHKSKKKKHKKRKKDLQLSKEEGEEKRSTEGSFLEPGTMASMSSSTVSFSSLLNFGSHQDTAMYDDDDEIMGTSTSTSSSMMSMSGPTMEGPAVPPYPPFPYSPFPTSIVEESSSTTFSHQDDSKTKRIAEQQKSHKEPEDLHTKDDSKLKKDDSKTTKDDSKSTEQGEHGGTGGPPITMKKPKKGTPSSIKKKPNLNKRTYSDQELDFIINNPPPVLPFQEEPKPFKPKSLTKCKIHEITKGVPKIGCKMVLPSKNVYLNGTVKTVGQEFHKTINSAQDLPEIVRYIQPCHMGIIEDEKGPRYRYRQFIHQGGRCWYVTATLVKHIDARFRTTSLLKNNRNYDFYILCHFHNRYPNGMPMIMDDVYYHQNGLGTNDPVDLENDQVKHRLDHFERKRKKQKKSYATEDEKDTKNSAVSAISSMLHATSTFQRPSTLTSLSAASSMDAHPRSSTAEMASFTGSGSGSSSSSSTMSLVPFSSHETLTTQATTLFSWMLKKISSSEHASMEEQKSYLKMINMFETLRPQLEDALQTSSNMILQGLQHVPQFIPELLSPFLEMKSSQEISKIVGERAWYVCVLFYLIQTKAYQQLKPNVVNAQLLNQQILSEMR